MTQQTSPVISVVIPVFNGAKTIGQQLDALRKQDFESAWEIVIANNRSTDDTVKVVREYAKDFPVPIRIVDATERKGVAYARNAGVAATRSKKFAICDADDIVTRGWLSAAYEALDHHDFATGPCQLFSTSTQHVTGTLGHSEIPILGGTELLGGNFAGRRDKYTQLGGMNESFSKWGGEDAEFSIRATLAGCACTYSANMTIFYRQTTRLRDLLRKRAAEGMNAVAIWREYPEYYAQRLGVVRGVRQFLNLLVHQVRARKYSTDIYDLAYVIGSVFAQMQREHGVRLGPSELSDSIPLLFIASENVDIRLLRSASSVERAQHNLYNRFLLTSTMTDLPDILDRFRVLKGNISPQTGLIRSARTIRMAVRAIRPEVVIPLDIHAAYVLGVTPLPRSVAFAGRNMLNSENVASVPAFSISRLSPYLLRIARRRYYFRRSALTLGS